MNDLMTAGEQVMFDLALDRDARRDRQGYVTPAEARAFLQMSRRIDRRQSAASPSDPVTRDYFRGLEERTASSRDDESTQSPALDRLEAAPDAPAEAVAAIVELLHDAGVMPRTPRALLESANTSVARLERIRRHLQFAHDREPGAYATRNAELAYLANIIVAGATIQSRSLTAEEGSNAAVAVCNLGLEHWPAEVPEDFLTHHDLVSVFQVGWVVLYEDVCMHAAEQLIGIVTSLDSADSHVHDELAALRATLTKHSRAGRPWKARDALEVIAILDTPSWAALQALLDQLPTLHAAIDASLTHSTNQVDAAAFEFISEKTQIQQVHEFMRNLPRLLRG
jgi:hypothetical protein